MSEGIGWLRGVVFDAEDPEKLAGFWQKVLGVGVAKREPGWIALEPGRSGVLLAFQPVDEGRPKTIKVRLDIVVEELDGPTDQVVALGAKLLEVVRYTPTEEHRVFADPEGNEFNLVLPEPEPPASPPAPPS
jgi:predicted enzyme related to lactoylglutathione lyase